MDGHVRCCRYEPSLDDLLADDVMMPVLRSAGFDLAGFREMMLETARRMDNLPIDGLRPHNPPMDELSIDGKSGGNGFGHVEDF